MRPVLSSPLRNILILTFLLAHSLVHSLTHARMKDHQHTSARARARASTDMRDTNPSKREASITHLDALRAKICVCEGLRQKLQSDNNSVLGVKETVR
jgi:hypothetical protein